jgi:hypothetical protein
MQISHAEARQLIQRSADAKLTRDDESALAAHLQSCPECGRHQTEIKDVEDALRSTMIKHWSHAPAPLDMNTITGGVRFGPQGRLGTQLVAISLMVLLLVFGAWRFVNVNVTPTMTMQISPIPTPSPQMTGTSTRAQNCNEVIHIVQQGETLEDIAISFSTSQEAILELNGLKPGTMRAGSRIRVPACFPPSATVDPVSFTLTYSPAPLTASSP